MHGTCMHDACMVPHAATPSEGEEVTTRMHGACVHDACMCMHACARRCGATPSSREGEEVTMSFPIFRGAAKEERESIAAICTEPEPHAITAMGRGRDHFCIRYSTASCSICASMYSTCM